MSVDIAKMYLGIYLVLVLYPLLTNQMLSGYYMHTKGLFYHIRIVYDSIYIF